MGLESGSFISALVSTNPVGATDPKSQGDDHIRFLKAKILETFPNTTGAVTATHTELNLVAGATGGLATLSVSFAALQTLVGQMGSFSASVTSSDITGSIRAPVLQTQAGFTAGTFTAATVTVNNKGIITNIAASSGLVAASQEEMESASSNAVSVTPGRAQYHPGAAKAWVVFNGTGVVAISASHNTASITDNGVGDYTWNFTTAFSSANYVVVGICGGSGSSSTAGRVVQAHSTVGPTASAFRFYTTQYTDGPQDTGLIMLTAYGDQ